VNELGSLQSATKTSIRAQVAKLARVLFRWPGALGG